MANEWVVTRKDTTELAHVFIETLDSTVLVHVNPSNTSVEHLVDICINEWETSMAKTLKYYGHTIEGA